MMLSTTWIISLPCQASVISAKNPGYAVIHVEQQISSKSWKNTQLNQYIIKTEDHTAVNPSAYHQSLLRLATNRTSRQITQITTSDPDGSAEDGIATPHKQPPKQSPTEWNDEFKMPEAERQILLKEYVKELAAYKTGLSWPHNKCRSKKELKRIATGLLDMEDKIARPLEIAQREQRLTPDLLKRVQAEIYHAYKSSYLEPGASGSCFLIEKKEREIFLGEQEDSYNFLIEVASWEQEALDERNNEIVTNSTEDVLVPDIKSYTPNETDIKNQETGEWMPSEQEKEDSEWILSESYKLYQFIKTIYDQTSGRFIIPYVTTDQMKQAKEDVQYIEKIVKRVNKGVDTERLWADATDFNKDNILVIKTHADIQYSEETAAGTKKFLTTLRNYAQTLKQYEGEQQTIKKDF